MAANRALQRRGHNREVIRPFALSRFAEGKLVNERAAAPAAALQ